MYSQTVRLFSDIDASLSRFGEQDDNALKNSCCKNKKKIRIQSDFSFELTELIQNNLYLSFRHNGFQICNDSIIMPLISKAYSMLFCFIVIIWERIQNSCYVFQ